MTTPALDPRDRLMRLATYFSVAAGLTLIGVKLAAWMAT
ncbi:MAG TPA: CDF family cation-efflux transporter FieF, partial [Rhodospirillaceae bacterium]|nr:CDF family cation-efflux transporter FieF [Rhodospirillaceae bacterium]